MYIACCSSQTAHTLFYASDVKLTTGAKTLLSNYTYCVWCHLYLSQKWVILSKLSYLSLVVEESQILELSQLLKWKSFPSRQPQNSLYFSCFLRSQYPISQDICSTGCTKGQIISECPYEKIVYPNIATKKFPRFLPWPLRRGQIINFIKPIKLNNP